MNDQDLNKLHKPISSVITVVFNGEEYIEETIKSVVSQKDSYIEYIVVDGKSSDSTLEIINKYKSRIDYIISEKDDGIYHAMNKGASIANGKYLCFLNASDIYFSGTLNDVYSKSLKENFDYFIAPAAIRGQDNIDLKIKYPIQNFSYQEGKYMGMPAPHLTVFVKKIIFDELGGYDLKFRISSDYDFLLRLSKNTSNFVYWEEPIGAFRLGGISGSFKIYLENYKIGIKHKIPKLQMIFITLWFLSKHFLKVLLPNRIVKKISRN